MLWIYGVTCVVLFFVPNPVGGNITRLAGIVIGPAAAFVLLRANRKRALMLVAAPLLIFQLLPVIGAISSAAGDPSTKPRYYQGMLSFLTENQQPLGRVEIPFTRDHWEAKYVAEKVPLARGWDRQVDLSRNAELYTPLTAAAYHTWLFDNAVRFVALPDAPLDQGGQAEKALLRHPPAYLRPVYTNNQWHIWAVVGAAPLASGAATMTSLTPSSFTMNAAVGGVTFVRLRWSTYWHVDNNAMACVAPAGGGWTTVISFAPGTVKVSARALPGDSRMYRPAACPVRARRSRRTGARLLRPPLHRSGYRRHYIAAATAATTSQRLPPLLHRSGYRRYYIAAATAATTSQRLPPPMTAVARPAHARSPDSSTPRTQNASTRAS